MTIEKLKEHCKLQIKRKCDFNDEHFLVLAIIDQLTQLQQEKEKIKMILNDFRGYVKKNGSMLKNPNVVDLLLKYNEIVFKENDKNEC